MNEVDIQKMSSKLPSQYQNSCALDETGRNELKVMYGKAGHIPHLGYYGLAVRIYLSTAEVGITNTMSGEEVSINCSNVSFHNRL